ncbi:FUSC family protein [Actinophytocola sediminis]
MAGLASEFVRVVSKARLRSAARRRVRALRYMALPILQCGIAAGVAWLVATNVFDHPRPFFAPIAVIISIGVGLGQRRLRRVAELIVGVSLGIGIGDLLVYSIGTGPWQIALVVTLAMTVAVALDGGPLITVQAGASAVLVAALVPPGTTGGLDRMVDALIGGLLGLAAVALLPGNPPKVARRHARQMIMAVAGALTSAADAIDTRDPDLAVRALRRIQSQQAIDDYRDALRTARDILAIAPVHWRQRQPLRAYISAAEPLDSALRNIRVLLRRTRSALADGEPVPPVIPVALRGLAEAAGEFAERLWASRGEVRQKIGEAVSSIEVESLVGGGFSAQVVAAQTRSVAVDLLQATGMRHDEARAVLPPIT